MPEETLRLFFALPCPPEQAKAICAWRDGQALDGRPVAESNLHITLAFLGAQPKDRLGALLSMASGIEGTAFDLRLDRLATIGKGFICLQPSTPAPALLALVTALGEHLAALGVVLDSRPFLPHLTLARQALDRPQGPAPAFAWRVGHFVLYLSRNTADGVRYEPLGRWPLQPPAGEPKIRAG